MLAWSTATGVGVVAHGIHYAVLAAGLAGLLLLLVPHLIESRRLRSGAGTEPEPRDAHEARVLALRAEIAQLAGGGAGTTTLTTASDPTARATTLSATSTAWRDRPSVEASVWLPLAVVGSVSAAVVHAAVCPDHLREKLVFGVFFAALALAQVGWAFLLARTPTVPLLLAGAVADFLVLALWTVTRVEGLPLGLLPRPEAAGRWDLAASAAELVVVVTCVLLLRRGRRGGSPARMAPFAAWHPGVQVLTLASAAGLVALSLTGVSS